MTDPDLATQANLQRLSNNPYPGRGLVLGTSDDNKHSVLVYWLMGRSENSRNRVLREDGDRLFTNFADPSKGGDPALVIYNAMRVRRGYFIVSNGDQTDTVHEAFGYHFNLSASLEERKYEPDAPNYTPRITGVVSMRGGPFAQISVLRRSPWETTERHAFIYDDIDAGYGYGVHTYQGDGNPLPTWDGAPVLLPLHGGPKEVAQTYWDLLNEENRVALAVRFTDAGEQFRTIIINKYDA